MGTKCSRWFSGREVYIEGQRGCLVCEQSWNTLLRTHVMLFESALCFVVYLYHGMS